MEWGSEEKDLRKMWRETGEKPPSLKKKPKLKPGVDRYYLDVFNELSPSRPQGEGFGPIPQSQYLAWFETYGVTSLEERERHQRILRVLDNVFVTRVNEKRQQQMEGLKKGSSRGSSPPRR